ncbi:MAG: RsmB/NOP family class I SAM-dependent RNA methyltransferase [Acidobacteriota bacterium]
MSGTNELPVKFRERLQQILPAACFADCWQTFHQTPATSLRVNPLKTDRESLVAELRAAGFELAPLSWKDDAFTVPHAQRRALTESAACGAGRLYIQNPASMVPPLVLDPRPDEWILDLTAAPGSKTLQLAGMMGSQGRISAVEAVRSRFFRLKRNLEAGGASHVRTYLKDGAQVWRSCPEQFDRVLLDAPCSSEGQFNAVDPQTYAYWSQKKIAEMSRKQRRLLFSAIQCLKPGGVLVYSTCTFAPEENEGVVARLLEHFGEALRIEAVELPCGNVQEGLVEWQGKGFDPELRQAARILPDGVMEGFFVCRMRKVASTVDSG